MRILGWVIVGHIAMFDLYYLVGQWPAAAALYGACRLCFD